MSKTDQEVKEKGTCGFHLKKIKDKKKSKEGADIEEGADRGLRRGRIFFFSLHFFIRFTKIGPLEFIGRRMKVYLLDEGYAWVPKTRDFTKNSGADEEKKSNLD